MPLFQLVYLGYSCAQHVDVCGLPLCLVSLPPPLASTEVPDSRRAGTRGSVRAEGPSPHPGFLVPSGCLMFKADLFSGGCFPESPGPPLQLLGCGRYCVPSAGGLCSLVLSGPLHSLTAGVPTPEGQDSNWLQSGLVVVQPRWEQCGSSQVEPLAAASSFSSSSVRVCVGARLAPSSENSLGRRANTSTFDPHVGWGSQHSRSSLQKFLHKSSLHPTPEAGVKPQES